MKMKLLLPVLLSLGLPALAPAAECCEVGEPTATADVDSTALPDESIYHFDATFTDDTGAERTLAEFRGDPVVVTMFFASCGYACPMLAHDMAVVAETLPPAVRERVHFVMISFDTERDTVPALRGFRERMGLAKDWTLMRGEAGDIRTLSMLLGVQFRREPSGDYSHSNLITVLDAGGAIAHRRTGLQGGLPALGEVLVRLAQ